MIIGRSRTDLNSARPANGEERLETIELGEGARPTRCFRPALEDALDGAAAPLRSRPRPHPCGGTPATHENLDDELAHLIALKTRAELEDVYGLPLPVCR